jgi:sigma-E factor negative regulatory protein RseA
MMSDVSLNEADRLQCLSELVDGETNAVQAQQLCRAWKDDPALRGTWHAYHLIGDVLRSEDLAHPADRDERFLASLRERLAQEPTVLAPTARQESRPMRRSSWLAPVAVAAGFVVVAGVLVMTRVAQPLNDSTATLASGSPVPRVLTHPATVESLAEVQGLVADGKLIRDARLERYLAAHKQYGVSSPVAVPVVVLSSSAKRSPER